MSHPGAEQANITQFHQGTTVSAYEFMGAHPAAKGEQEGYCFRVWAPAAKEVSVVGDFNAWEHDSHPMEKISQGV